VAIVNCIATQRPPFFNCNAYNAPEWAYKISTQFYDGVKVQKLILNFDSGHRVALVLKRSKITRWQHCKGQNFKMGHMIYTTPILSLNFALFGSTSCNQSAEQI